VIDDDVVNAAEPWLMGAFLVSTPHQSVFTVVRITLSIHVGATGLIDDGLGVPTKSSNSLFCSIFRYFAYLCLFWLFFKQNLSLEKSLANTK
jgi:UDP-N-acetylmuramyl pentapeptide phosphotransferase/UDP-N-acetylglucosamine-1-phosphate transferase